MTEIILISLLIVLSIISLIFEFKDKRQYTKEEVIKLLELYEKKRFSWKENINDDAIYKNIVKKFTDQYLRDEK